METSLCKKLKIWQYTYLQFIHRLQIDFVVSEKACDCMSRGCGGYFGHSYTTEYESWPLLGVGQGGVGHVGETMCSEGAWECLGYTGKAGEGWPEDSCQDSSPITVMQTRTRFACCKPSNYSTFLNWYQDDGSRTEKCTFPLQVAQEILPQVEVSQGLVHK